MFSVPTFDGYPIMALMCGLTACTSPLNDYGMQDLDAMSRPIEVDTTVAIACRPHNPQLQPTDGRMVESLDARSMSTNCAAGDEGPRTATISAFTLPGPIERLDPAER